MTVQFQYPKGATPLDRDEIDGLIPSHISTQGELNEAEQANIIKARQWGFRKNRDILSDTFVRELHKRMFGEVWRWAGKYRLTAKNIGVPAHQVASGIGNLLADCEYWIQNSAYPFDELGARFHHRLVAIHPFPNGNGRHARLMTDVLMKSLGKPIFTWGAMTSGSEVGANEDVVRNAYLSALREADEHRFEKLLIFVRS